MGSEFTLFLSKPLLQEAEALSRLASEESLALDVEQQLGLEIRKLTVQIQVRRGNSLGAGELVVMVGEQLKCFGIATECIFSRVDYH